MNLYYVIPTANNRYASREQAIASFESGHIWMCTGKAQIHGGVIEKVTRFSTHMPVQVNSATLPLGQRVKADAWALDWNPGQTRPVIQLVRKPGPPAKVRVDNRLTAPPAPAPRITRDYDVDKIVLGIEFKRHGSYCTSGGLRFTPYALGQDVDRQNFPLITWEPSGLTGFPEFDPDLNCHTAGDRELERQYTAAQHRAYNPYGKRLQRAASGCLNDGDGNSFTAQAPDPDQLTDSSHATSDRTGHTVGTSGHFAERY
jgi:hypothetical protein